MANTIRFTKVIDIVSNTENPFLKKIHQSTFVALNNEMQQDGFDTWDELRNYGKTSVEIENLITEKANNFIEKGKNSQSQPYFIPDLNDTLGDQHFTIDKIKIKVISAKHGDNSSCKLRSYLMTNKVTLLDSFGKFLLISFLDDQGKNSICTVELGTGISVTAYE